MSTETYVYTQLAISSVFVLVLVAFGVYWLTQKEEESTATTGNWVITSVLLALQVGVMVTYAMRFSAARSLALSE